MSVEKKKKDWFKVHNFIIFFLNTHIFLISITSIPLIGSDVRWKRTGLGSSHVGGLVWNCMCAGKLLEVVPGRRQENFSFFFFFFLPVGGHMKDCKSFSSPQHFESFLILSVILLVRHLKAIQGQPSRQPLSEYKGDGWGIHRSSEFCPFLRLFFVPTELITWNST